MYGTEEQPEYDRIQEQQLREDATSDSSDPTPVVDGTEPRVRPSVVLISGENFSAVIFFALYRTPKDTLMLCYGRFIDWMNL